MLICSLASVRRYNTLSPDTLHLTRLASSLTLTPAGLDYKSRAFAVSADSINPESLPTFLFDISSFLFHRKKNTVCWPELN